MKYLNRVLVTSLAVLFFAALAAAQPKTEQKAQQIIPLKVQVVLSEYAGAKKISSLPYTLTVNTASRATHLRLGLRVPVATGGGSAGQGTQWQYLNMGTNIDCSAKALPNGQFQLDITVDRNSAYPAGTANTMRELHIVSMAPIMRNFRVSNTLILRNGQTDESTVATDPTGGHVLRVSVTLHVRKSAP
jgi:hypothetical protein